MVGVSKHALIPPAGLLYLTIKIGNKKRKRIRTADLTATPAVPLARGANTHLRCFANPSIAGFNCLDALARKGIRPESRDGVSAEKRSVHCAKCSPNEKQGPGQRRAITTRETNVEKVKWC
ncbi:uncharacterized protein MELLADRAFT_109953 [Melampsora larici-populina 98AG31]|uniref:Uncharacterized protein n=1 Tax=Melampsora larici-populina (strain 98AG31 / pathotype 3-4-7) TaxID=747676 RepID=F4RY60_MELLP|nr:uncharacterized protein MELLADRAFT_109953 [Melampsora larici-populina 98AG31]EGG02626.1 hypothetical protein MELLADRAFT_109953 [Melampsora larici-populina 98AG31]